MEVVEAQTLRKSASVNLQGSEVSVDFGDKVSSKVSIENRENGGKREILPIVFDKKEMYWGT